MFRTLVMFTLLLSTATAASAAEPSLEPCINGGVSSRGNHPTFDVDEYVQTQLDWRSYYAGRLAARRDERPSGSTTWPLRPPTGLN